MTALHLPTAVVTIVRGRHAHLYRQLPAVAPTRQVLVAMGDPEVRTLAVETPTAVVVELTLSPQPELPLARARNVGAERAIADGAQLLIFLDVDCIPGPTMAERYVAAALTREHGDALLCGPVSYLPPAPAQGYDLERLAELARPHPGRPNPGDGEVLPAQDRSLFWSLSFALRSSTWQRIGGFDEAYTGYGGEDTDFVERAHRAGVGMRWVGGAHAFHQHHPISSPPVEHVRAIVRNAQIFHQRWGWWPMSGWLDQFAERGLVRYDAQGGWQTVVTR